MKSHRKLAFLGALLSVAFLSGCSATPSKVTTENYSKMETNDPCVTKRANCTPEQAALSAAAYAEQEKRIDRLEERQHQAEVRETDNRITDNARMSDLGN